MPTEIDFLFAHVVGNASFVHGLGIAVDQHNFVAHWG